MCLVVNAEMDLAEKRALTRDNLGRTNPDELLYGFIPVWAIVVYLIAGNLFIKFSRRLKDLCPNANARLNTYDFKRVFKRIMKKNTISIFF
jgi:hypothetical protein